MTDAFNTMASRLATIEQTRRRLLTDLAHELRTPLASIEATIEAVTDGILPADQSTLDTLTDQSQRLHRLVGDLSAVSRAEERQLNLDPVLVPLQDVVSAAVAAARPRFDAKAITLTVPTGGCSPTPTGWPRHWARYSTTRYGIRPKVAPSPSLPPPRPMPDRVVRPRQGSVARLFDSDGPPARRRALGSRPSPCQSWGPSPCRRWPTADPGATACDIPPRVIGTFGPVR